jgi:hypothetical protein
MQYALSIYENEQTSFPEGEDSEAWQAILEAHNAFGGDLAQSGAMRGGAGLKPVAMATTVRVTPQGRTVHDGPFAETREQLGGFYLVEAADLDAAIEIARRLPIAVQGSIEIRPCLEMPEPG